MGTDTRVGRATPHAWRFVGLGAAIAAISLAHVLTDASRVLLHAVLEYLYYAPIVAAASWYGALGGLLSALVASLAFIPHIQTTWADNEAYAASQYAQIVAFHLIGGFVGLLMTNQKRLTARFRDAATTLEARHRELERSQAELRRAERLSALGEMAAGLAHELRNPLAGVRGALDIVSSRVQQATPEAEFAEVARTELDRLGSLLDEFLAYARPRPPELRLMTLAPVIDRVAALLSTEADRRGVRLEVATLDGSVPVDVDPEQMTQVLVNVVLNAIQASDAEGRVAISQVVGDDSLRLVVEDEGHGIAEADLTRIFDPFFTTKHRGSGLGLAISQRIVSAHGGTIDVAARPGGGTMVSIRLPRTTRTIADDAQPMNTTTASSHA